MAIAPACMSSGVTPGRVARAGFWLMIWSSGAMAPTAPQQRPASVSSAPMMNIRMLARFAGASRSCCGCGW